MAAFSGEPDVNRARSFFRVVPKGDIGELFDHLEPDLQLGALRHR